jgi:PAS domain S-box-containing protein
MTHSMADENKTRDQLVQDLIEVRRQLSELTGEITRVKACGQLEALRQSNERFRLAAEAAHIGTYSRNFQTGEDYWSPEFLTIHGFSPDHPMPLRDGIPITVHPADHQRVLDNVRACLDRADKPEFSTKHRIILPSGEIRWVMLRGLVQFDGQGRPLQKHGMVMDITEREREQQALQESEERFRIMADGLPLIVWVHDAEGQQQFVNRTFLEFFGVTSDQVSGGRWQQLVHPDDRAAHTGEFLACVRERRPFHAEVRVRRRDGQWAWIESWGRPRLSASGEYLGFVGTSADITERRQIEAAILKTEASYRMLFDTMDEAFAIKEMIEDIEGGLDFLFIEANPAFERQTGLRDVAGRTMRQLMPGIEPRWMARYAKVVRTGERIRFEDYVADLGRWFDVLCWRIEGADNRRAAILATDITERKRAEEALRMAYERLQTIFDHRIDGIGIAISCPDGKVIQANDYLLKIFGCTREELMSGQVDWRAMTPPEWLAADDYALQQLTDKGIYHSAEKEYVRRDGSRVPVLISGATMPGNSDEILSFILDITDRKRFEQSLHQLNLTLEQQVTERTALAERRAHQLQALSVELIEAEEREKQRIAGLLHDDLQQLLAAARFTLQSSSHADPALEEVERLLEEAIRKSRSLSHELSPAMLQQPGLGAALEWLCGQMQERFGLTVQLDKVFAIQVHSAPLRFFLFHAVRELLFNIVKHAGVNSARVQLAGSHEEFVITVSDAGKGFDILNLESCTPKAGLGLLSLRERASYIGGSLTIESTTGQGSRACLRVPTGVDNVICPKDTSTAIAERAHPQTGVYYRVADEPGIRVLFVDDHKVMRQGLIQLICGQPNIQVVGEAANGREALELARQLRPDVVVMDVSMPVMDGIEATLRIKTELPEVRVIGLSMHENEDIARTMRAAGAEAFVSKTASWSALLEAIYGLTGDRSDTPLIGENEQ